MPNRQSKENTDYLTPAEVAKLLLVAPVTVRQWAQKGWIQADQTAGGHRRFLRHEVERFARERGLTLHFQRSDNLRVLIVDDDPQVSRYLTELLCSADGIAEIEAAADGFEAGTKVRSFQPDVILLDLMMPGMDGFSVCQILKADPATRGIRVIAMTGYPTLENEQRILQAGAEYCLHKPFERSELFRVVGVESTGMKLSGNAAPAELPGTD